MAGGGGGSRFSGERVARSTRRADLIAALGETTGKPAFERVLERMKRSAEGKAMLLERPRVISANVGHACNLPENTFGAAFARFMRSRNFSLDDRPPLLFMDTNELAYVAMLAHEVGTSRLNEKQRTLFFQHYFPWAVKCVYYKQLFLEDLEDVRRKWGIIPAPTAPK